MVSKNRLPPESYNELEIIFQDYYWLKRTQSILSWDSAVNLPSSSSYIREQQALTLNKAIVNTLTNSKVHFLLEKCTQAAYAWSPWQKSNLREMTRLSNQISAIPLEIQNQLAAQCVKTEICWRNARDNNHFESFIKPFQTLLNMVQKKSELLAKQNNCSPYESLIREYDFSANEKEYDNMFLVLEESLPSLYKSAKKKSSLKKSTHPLLQLNEQNQKLLFERILQDIGFDFKFGKLDRSAHPFTEGGFGDVRITIDSYNPNFFDSMMATLHEGGHALYDQNLPKTRYFQPCGADSGMVIHEAIALFYEMMLGRTKSFANYIHLISQKINARINRSDLETEIMSLDTTGIRIKADEISYLLHIILRYQIEKRLVEGTLKVKEIPEFWNETSYTFFGKYPKSDSSGCLQDIHWSLGYFGYFPTYGKGLLLAHALYKNLEAEVTNLDFNSIFSFLKSKIFSKGALHSQENLLKKLNYRSNQPEEFIRHLKQKFCLK